MCGPIKTKLRSLSKLPVFKVSSLADDPKEAPSERARRFALRCCLTGEPAYPPRELYDEMDKVTALIDDVADTAARLAWSYVLEHIRQRHGAGHER